MEYEKIKQTRKGNEMKKLKGYLQSGILFIGDPQYMSGPVEYGTVPVGKLSGRELTPAVAVDITPEDPYNPFRSWDRFAYTLGEQDAVLPFQGASPDSDGRGVAVQTNRMSGQYEITKIADENGKLLELRITFKD
jgi:hypothetical protein